jgi:hypothetical protein
MAIKITTPKPRAATALPAGMTAEAAADISLITEKFARISDKILLMWGSIELQQFLSGLIFDDRGGRQGFPPPIAAALVRIHGEHSKLFPDTDHNAWNKVLF